MKSNEEIAFADLKGVVGVVEFEAVIDLATKEYAKLLEVTKKRDNFAKRAQEGLDQINGDGQGLSKALAEKLITGLERKANKDVYNLYSQEIDRHEAVTSFLNRFKDTSDQLPLLDLTFIKNI